LLRRKRRAQKAHGAKDRCLYMRFPSVWFA
jgi:hypothetical protein